MDDAAFVGVVDGAGERFDQADGVRRRPGHARELIGQAFAGHIFQRQVRMACAFADFVNLHDVRMRQLGGGLGLDAKSLAVQRPGVRPGQDHL